MKHQTREKAFQVVDVLIKEVVCIVHNLAISLGLHLGSPFNRICKRFISCAVIPVHGKLHAQICHFRTEITPNEVCGGIRYRPGSVGFLHHGSGRKQSAHIPKIGEDRLVFGVYRKCMIPYGFISIG